MFREKSSARNFSFCPHYDSRLCYWRRTAKERSNARAERVKSYIRGTQRQFSENICSEDDLRSRIFGTFVVKILACLPVLGFSNIYKKKYNCPFLKDFYPKKVT